MTRTRTIDNRNRPAQPEPDEDPALHTPPVREGVKKADGTVERTGKKAPQRSR